MREGRYVHREIEPRLKKLARKFPSLVLTGPRQSGKSTLLKKIFFKSHRYITFDDPLARQKAVSDPRFFLDECGEPVILDEIQYVPELLSYLKIRIDEEREKTGRFVLTGSQKFPFIKNLSDSLAGRIALLSLLPFSREELKHLPGLRVKTRDTSSAFVEACLRGSYPELNVRKNTDPQEWYAGYLQTYLERDIRTIFNIGSLREFQKFLQLLAARCGQILNLSSFSGDLGVSVNTLKSWLSVLEAGQIIYLLTPYYRNLGKRITKNPKVYFLDCGLACYLVGIRDKRYLLNGPMAGPLFENYVVQETVKAYSLGSYPPALFYARTQNGLEVDLIVERGMQLFPFEIKLTKTPKQEMGLPLRRFKEIFSGAKTEIKDGRMITLNDEPIRLTQDISTIPLDDFLCWVKSK